MDIPPLAFSNGTAICDDYLYVVESQRPGVVAVPLEGGDLEPLVTLDTAVSRRDRFRRRRGLWISCFQPDRVYRLSPEGALTP